MPESCVHQGTHVNSLSQHKASEPSRKLLASDVRYRAREPSLVTSLPSPLGLASCRTSVNVPSDDGAGQDGALHQRLQES